MKLAFITPRYGAEIANGPEHACRLLAEAVSERHDVDVLTTCARDAHTWKNEYAEGSDRVRGVIVRRFPVAGSHDPQAFAQLSQRLQTTPRSSADELDWVRRHGPWSPSLIEHLKRQHRSYDALVFFSLHHPTTVQGLQIAPERSALFPYVQLRPELRFGLWPDLLASVKAVGLFSSSESRLIHDYVRATPQFEEVVGIGTDPPLQLAYPRHQQNPADTVTSEDEPATDSDAEEVEDDSYLSARGVPFRRRHRLHGQFVLYGGRVDTDNGCEEMLDYFDSFAADNGEMSLVLMGVKMMKVPEERYLRFAGVLPDRDRMAAYEAAEITIAPASDDLLAQALLESFAVGTPVLASARNAAATEHCRRANAGLYYSSREEFVEALRLLTGNTRVRESLGASGRNYVRQHHRWEHVLGRFERVIGRIKGR